MTQPHLPQQPHEADAPGSRAMHPATLEPLILSSLPFPSLLLPSLILLLITILLLPPQLIAQPVQPNAQTQLRQQRSSKIDSHIPTSYPINDHRMSYTRVSRQSRPRETLWQLYVRLMNEGANDTGSAFSQIRQLFSTLIKPDRPKENLSTTENATVAVGAEAGDGDGTGGEANDTLTTTTTEPPPRKISTGELMGIFRRNVFGLGRLFGREFWNAIQQSNRNLEMYSKQWQDVVRPYLE